MPRRLLPNKFSLLKVKRKRRHEECTSPNIDTVLLLPVEGCSSLPPGGEAVWSRTE
jgi:hypothetical protein